jgi:hypothetical protein
MTAPLTSEQETRDVADVVDEAAQNPVTDGRGMNRLVRQLIAVLTQFIVSVARGPIVTLIDKAFIARQSAHIALLKIELKGDPSFIAQIRKDLDYDVDRRVSQALEDIDRRVANEVARQIAQREKALIAAIVRRNRRSHLFAVLGALFGAAVGAFTSWYVLTNYFLTGTVIDGTGKAWVATSIADQAAYAGFFIFAGTTLVSVIGCIIGAVIDVIRDRRR